MKKIKQGLTVRRAAAIRTDSQRRQLLAGLAGLPALLWRNKASATTPLVCDVAVIGAGVFGSWIAWHLAQHGQQVVLVDAYTPGNGLSSSGGDTRVTRMAYGPDAIYSRMATESLTHWKALDARHRPSIPLFHPTGVLWLSRHRNTYFDHSLDTLQALGIPTRVFDSPSALQRAYPQIDYHGIGTGFLEPGSGALAARQCVRVVAEEAMRNGVRWLQATAAAPESVASQKGKRLRIPLRTATGPAQLLARQAVYACGAWLPKVFPQLLAGRIVPTRQEVFYLNLKAVSESLAARYAPDRFPVWADFNDGDVFYGIPDMAGYGFKIAHDKHGSVMDPNTADRRVSVAAEREMRAYLRKRFPELAEAPLASVRVCQYENTSNGDFLLDRHPSLDSVWLAGGGSGHGFKHGPAVGRWMAELVTGTRSHTHPRFTLASKGTTQKREVV